MKKPKPQGYVIRFERVKLKRLVGAWINQDWKSLPSVGSHWISRIEENELFTVVMVANTKRQMIFMPTIIYKDKNGNNLASDLRTFKQIMVPYQTEEDDAQCTQSRLEA